MTGVVVLDVESTGKDRFTDQIIEICLLLGADEAAESRSWRIRPRVPIAAEATAVHGLTEADLIGCPPFGEAAPAFMSLLRVAEVIVGYNVAFDLDMLQAELERAGLPLLELGTKQIVDVLRLWHHVEPRTLVAAYQKFCGVELVGAHQARADVAATARVLTAMRGTFGLADKSWAEVAAISDPLPTRASWVGPSSHIQWADDHAVFGFGKHKGLRVELAEVGFLRWIEGKDFPAHVKEICKMAAKLQPEQLQAWLRGRYPRQRALALEEGL